MKKIAVCFGGEKPFDAPLNDPAYFQGYLDLGEELAKRNAELYLVRALFSYAGGNRFSSGLRYSQGKFEEVQEPFEADLLLNKSSKFFPDEQATVINDKKLDDLCNDKTRMLEIFRDLFPNTIVVENPDDLPEALAQIPSKRVVVKPISGYGGSGVFIGERHEVQAPPNIFPVVAQEFIDTSEGVPGITTTNHDMRIVVTGKNEKASIALMFIRTPRPGSLLSNVAKGGYVTIVDRPLWPKELLPIVERVDKEFQKFPQRFYSVDLGRNTDGTWKLIELNAPPGTMSRLECGNEADRYFEVVCDLLLQ